MAEPADSEPGAAGPGPESSLTQTGTTTAKPAARSSRTRTLVEWGVIIVAALLVAFLIKTFLIQAFFIPSASMEPTLRPGDRVLVDKLSYDLHSVHRGDIVVFAKPADDEDPGVTDLIKRVIGLPGQTISSGPRGAILINGTVIPQPWLTPGAEVAPGPVITNRNQFGQPDCANTGPLVDKCVIPAGQYFVMGDNRGDSSDSRAIGPIPRKLIVGRAFVLVWPFSRFHWF